MTASTDHDSWDDPKYLKAEDSDGNGHCVHCGTATVHLAGCVVLTKGPGVDTASATCPDCQTVFGTKAHVCVVSGGTRCPICKDLCPDNEVAEDICIDCFERDGR